MPKIEIEQFDLCTPDFLQRHENGSRVNLGIAPPLVFSEGFLESYEPGPDDFLNARVEEAKDIPSTPDEVVKEWREGAVSELVEEFERAYDRAEWLPDIPKEEVLALCKAAIADLLDEWLLSKGHLADEEVGEESALLWFEVAARED